MKIEKITICNLASIAGEQVVDFTREPLRSAGLFAITGDTGAGKSTILDAICLALYDEAPRLMGVERNDRSLVPPADSSAGSVKPLQPGNTRNMLRRGCKEGYAEVEFSVPDGARYRARWYVRLKRTRNYDDVVRTLERLSPRRETFDSRKIQQAIDGIIGLDYQQFSRTVMLAQGSFSNFIKARREEKSALLEKLTGTEIYRDISVSIHRLAGEAGRERDDLENEVKGILHDRLGEEELREVREEKRRLETSLARFRDAADATERQLAWHEEFLRLSAGLRECEQAETEARKRYASMRGEELRLERYDSVLCVQPVFQDIVRRGADIAASKSQEAALAKDIEAARDRLRDSGKALESASERLDEIEGRHQLRLPGINRGYTLAGEIKEADLQLDGWRHQLKEARDALVRSQAAVAAGREQLAAVREEVERQSLRRQALAVHRRWFDKYDSVKDKLAALDAGQKSLEENLRRMETRRRQQEDLAQAHGQAEKMLRESQGRMDALRSELLVHVQANRGHDGAELQQRFAESSRRLQLLQGARALWARVSAAYEDIEEKKAACNRRSAELTRLAAELERLGRERDVLDEAYRRLGVSCTLSRSKDIVRLRQQLQEGTACPVCGAMHHPYHTETEREMGKLISSLEKEYAEMGEELSRKTAALGALREKQAAEAAALEAERRSLEETRRHQDDNVAQWAQFARLDASFSDCSSSANREARRVMISQLLEGAARTAEEAEQEWKAFNGHQESINRLNDGIAALNGRMEESRASLEKMRTEMGVATAAAEELQKNADQADRAVRQLYDDISALLAIPGWTAEWEQSSDGFRNRLSGLHRDWTDTCRLLEEGSQREVLLRKDLEATEEKAAEDERELNRRREKCDSLSESLESKRQELRRLFGEGSPEAEEARFRQLTAEARAGESAARRAKEEAAARLGLLEGRLRSLQDTRAGNEETLRRKRTELDGWMLRYNGQHPPLRFSELEAIFGSGRDWNALRGELDRLRSACGLAGHRLQAAQESLRQWLNRPERPSADGEEDLEALRRKREELRARAEETTRLLAVADDRLRSHERCERNAAAMQEKVQAARENAEQWRRLCELFGSADGKRFRNLAQSYTFGSLVDHANRQLRLFFPRYELRNEAGSLDLEIIDREMFDQRRYVHSLSGGETFVVSLALALGLASLSSDNLQIGSLFIDEGFGNLDRDSLDMVMGALANLENTQGRKVGVISHTEQIQAQITPQIHLVKYPSGGRSKIEIV